MKKRKEYKGKWKDKGINKIQREAIYSKLRSKAKIILKNKYREEYLLILKDLKDKDLKKRKLKIEVDSK